MGSALQQDKSPLNALQHSTATGTECAGVCSNKRTLMSLGWSRHSRVQRSTRSSRIEGIDIFIAQRARYRVQIWGFRAQI